jgi:hypothetical protein
VAGRSKINLPSIVPNRSNTVEGDRATRAVRQPRSAEGNVLAIPSRKAENLGIVAVSVGAESSDHRLLLTVWQLETCWADEGFTLMRNPDEPNVNLEDTVEAIVTAESGQEAFDAVLRVASSELAPETKASLVNSLICEPRSRVRFWGMMIAGKLGDSLTLQILGENLERNRSAVGLEVTRSNIGAIQSWIFTFKAWVELTGSSAVPRIKELLSCDDAFWQWQAICAADRLPRDDRVNLLREIESRHNNTEIRKTATLRLARILNT